MARHSDPAEIISRLRAIGTDSHFIELKTIWGGISTSICYTFRAFINSSGAGTPALSRHVHARVGEGKRRESMVFEVVEIGADAKVRPRTAGSSAPRPPIIGVGGAGFKNGLSRGSHTGPCALQLPSECNMPRVAGRPVAEP